MMLELHDWLGGVMLVVLAIYAVTGGADFGGGVWDLLATGPRAKDQRRLIEQALAPVWEANHVWLIFVVVVLFSAFPPAFAAISIALYTPLSLVLLGVVLRGAGFVFRQYGHGSEEAGLRWGRVFAVASIITPLFLGVTLAAVSGGDLRLSSQGEALAASDAWQRPFALLSGIFVVAMFAFLAAVYLSVEAGSSALAQDFRRRAFISGIAVGVLSLAVLMGARVSSPHFEAALLGAWWSRAVQAAVGALAVAALIAIRLRQDLWARRLAIVQVIGIVAGWGLAQYPFLIAPSLTLAQEAAPKVVLQWILPTVFAGTIVLVPCLIWLMRLFKHHPPHSH